jgi:hypothetical protein
VVPGFNDLGFRQLTSVKVVVKAAPNLDLAVENNNMAAGTYRVFFPSLTTVEAMLVPPPDPLKIEDAAGSMTTPNVSLGATVAPLSGGTDYHDFGERLGVAMAETKTTTDHLPQWNSINPKTFNLTSDVTRGANGTLDSNFVAVDIRKFAVAGQLEVTYIFTPEPATGSLAGVAAMMCVARIRRSARRARVCLESRVGEPENYDVAGRRRHDSARAE